MLTVLHVLEALGAGCARHVSDLVTHVHDVRHVVVVPPERRGDVTDVDAPGRMRAAGATVHVVDMRRMPPHPRNAVAVARLRHVVARERPDIVHGHASIGGALARIAAPHGTPVVWTPNGVLTAPAAVAAERVLSRRTAAIVAVSPSEAALLTQLRIARPGQIHLIRNGIDLTPTADGTDLRAMLGIPTDARLVGMVARLAPQKAPLDFVEAARQVAAAAPDVHFVLIGDGRLANAVDAAVRRWDRDGRFHRIPVLPRAARVLGQLDVCVLTSRYEGAPYVPLEAMREGAPVVITDVVGSRDTVEDGRTGLVVGSGQPGQIAQGVLRLVQDAGMRAALAKRSRSWLVERGDVRRMGSEHRDLYERLARGDGQGRGGRGHRARAAVDD